MKINNKLVRQLQRQISIQEVNKFISKYQNQNNKNSKQLNNTNSSKRILSSRNSKFKRKFSSKQKNQNQKIVSKNQQLQQQSINQNISKNVIQQNNNQLPKKIIKDKAVFVNVSQLPYLHSTDLLNNLYKKSNLEEQNNKQTILYNVPSGNPHLLTKVKELHLYYCKIQSLRDIGTGWSNLKLLSIYFGQLKDLGGLGGFPSIQYLHCPFNQIQAISDVMFHPTLLSLDLQSNLINDFSQIEHLFTIQNLEYLNLLNNPIYQNKELKRKINEKFDKIIELEYSKLNDFVKQKQRQIWQIQNIQGIQSCNHLINEFFQITKNDEITVQNKYHNKIKMLKNNINRINFNQQSQIKDQQNQLEMKIQYIPFEIPDNAYFQDLILNKDVSKLEQNFCQEKIQLTPLIYFINNKNENIHPVINKYLMNKLIHKQEIKREKKTPIKDKQQINMTNTQKEFKKPQKMSRMALTGFISNQNNEKSLQTSKNLGINQFKKTTTSISTNVTNLKNNNAQHKQSLRKHKISLTKSKEKSLLRTKVQLLQTNQNKSSLSNINLNPLMKHNRLLINKNLNKQIQKVNQTQAQIQNKSQSINKIKFQVSQMIQKSSFSSTLKRRSMVTGSKRGTFFLSKNQSNLENQI